MSDSQALNYYFTKTEQRHQHVPGAYAEYHETKVKYIDARSTAARNIDFVENRLRRLEGWKSAAEVPSGDPLPIMLTIAAETSKPQLPSHEQYEVDLTNGAKASNKCIQQKLDSFVQV